MKKASSLFYLVGFIFNVIGLLISALLIILFAITVCDAGLLQQIAADFTVEPIVIRQFLVLFIIILAVGFVIETAISFLVLRAKKDLKEGTGKVGTHILLLILGILGFNLFYLIGGIFGVTVSNNADEDDD